MSNLCGVQHPLSDDWDVEARCVRGRGHRDLKHVDEKGHEWSDPGQVSGDRAWRIRDEALRELLSHCRSQSETPDFGQPHEAYDDVADRLAKILDGEE